MSKKRVAGLADPTQLTPRGGGKTSVQVVIETPKGSRNKYAFDPEQRVFTLHKVLPSGMVFPYDFGFIPQTEAEDGDPIDVLVLMDEPAFVGCILEARIIGVIEGDSTEDSGPKVRNDRLIAVGELSHTYAKIHALSDLSSLWLEEVEHFLVQYHVHDDTTFEVRSRKGRKTAMQLIAKAHKHYERRRRP